MASATKDRRNIIAFLILTNVYSGAFSMEPRCSEFNFLESLLEKLVRLESKVDAIQNDVSKEMTAIRGEVKEIGGQITDLKGTVDSISAQDLEHRLNEAEKTITSAVSKLQNDASPSAFTAYLDDTADHKVGDTVLFDKILTNVGNHYSPTTGRFTAPATGTYFFSWHTQSQAYITTCLSLNGTCQVHAYADGRTSNNTIFPDGNSAVLNLAKGDHVWIEVRYGSQIYSNKVQKWFYPTFTGHSLQ